MTTTTTPDIPLPAGTFLLCEESFEVWDGEYRLIWGDGHPAASTNFVVQPWATQLPDGSIPNEGADGDDMAGAQCGIHVDETRDGASYECLTVTVAGARGLAAALLAAADEVDGWASR